MSETPCKEVPHTPVVTRLFCAQCGGPGAGKKATSKVSGSLSGGVTWMSLGPLRRSAAFSSLCGLEGPPCLSSGGRRGCRRAFAGIVG